MDQTSLDVNDIKNRWKAGAVKPEDKCVNAGGCMRVFQCFVWLGARLQSSCRHCCGRSDGSVLCVHAHAASEVNVFVCQCCMLPARPPSSGRRSLLQRTRCSGVTWPRQVGQVVLRRFRWVISTYCALAGLLLDCRAWMRGRVMMQRLEALACACGLKPD